MVFFSLLGSILKVSLFISTNSISFPAFLHAIAVAKNVLLGIIIVLSFIFNDNNDIVNAEVQLLVITEYLLPILFENSQNIDAVIFIDAANIWGVDYDSSIDDASEIRSSIGVGVDYLTVVGPLSFSLSQVISKNDNDVVEKFRFNLGTTF